MAPTLSILSPTHDRPHVLSLVWPSWIVQEGVKEIIVVDDGSNEDYSSVFAEIAKACEARAISFKPLRLPTRTGAPAAKNAGLDLCTCTEVLTTDDDIVLPPDMVKLCRLSRPKTTTPTIAGPRVIYMQDNESESEALQRSNSSKNTYFNYSSLTLAPWAPVSEARAFPFVTAVALWPAQLFKHGLKYHEGYGGNGYREESDPQLLATVEFNASVYLTPAAHCFHLPPAVAYAKRGGQRRGGALWFEWWVLKNNATFLLRHRKTLKHKYKINLFYAWLSLACERFSPERIKKAIRKIT